ncbi:MAG: hypothetical protein II404_00910 [Prevotella sp.]|nr:hypothetical protein [Prevotella sp.]
MKHLLFILAIFAVCCACSGDSRERQAAIAAQQYFNHLTEGDAVRFLEGKIGIDSLPADYCEQLLKAIEQYRDDMQQKHGGLVNVLISDNTDQKSDTAKANPEVLAYLILCFGDSTQEEIVVPMVEADGQWLMK